MVSQILGAVVLVVLVLLLKWLPRYVKAQLGRGGWLR